MCWSCGFDEGLYWCLWQCALLQASLICTGCRGACLVFSSEWSGSFTDGSGVSNYPNNANCQWMIIKHAGISITITFTQFSTELGFDFVRVFSCSSSSCASPSELASLHGSLSVPQRFTSSTGFMLVTFTTDGSITNSGWRASWIAQVMCVGKFSRSFF